ncbi:MAG: DUF4878 domain-containing protein [Phocaeicola sp.]
MKTIYSILLVMLTTVILTSCGNANSPEGVVKKELSAVQSGNYEKAFECYYVKNENRREDIKEFYVKSMKEQQSKDENKIKSFKVTNVEYSQKSENEATVFFTMQRQDGSSSNDKTKTIKVNDKWYLESGK